MSDLVFLDTETTGLGPDDEIWEFAAIRRTPEGEESTLLLQVRHDTDKAAELPEKFYRDYSDRYDDTWALSPRDAAENIYGFLHGRPHLVGANPAFDAQMLTRLLAEYDLAPPWHYHLIDLEAVTVGYLLSLGKEVPIPWRSDDLAARVGAPTTDPGGHALYDRHTAMGDVEWCRDWWDALNGVKR